MPAIPAPAAASSRLAHGSCSGTVLPSGYGSYSIVVCASALLFIAVLRRRRQKRLRQLHQQLHQQQHQQQHQHQYQQHQHQHQQSLKHEQYPVPYADQTLAGSYFQQAQLQPPVPMPMPMPVPVPVGLLSTSPATYTPYSSSQLLAHDYGVLVPLPLSRAQTDPELTPLDTSALDAEHRTKCLSRSYTLPPEHLFFASLYGNRRAAEPSSSSSNSSNNMVQQSGEIILGPGFRRHIKVFHSTRS